jgi:hypothetical protein
VQFRGCLYHTILGIAVFDFFLLRILPIRLFVLFSAACGCPFQLLRCNHFTQLHPSHRCHRHIACLLSIFDIVDS